MKTKVIRLACLFTLLLALATEARAQTTAFTYQGRLAENGAPVNGSNDFTFTLYNAASGRVQDIAEAASKPMALLIGVAALLAWVRRFHSRRTASQKSL